MMSKEVEQSKWNRLASRGKRVAAWITLFGVSLVGGYFIGHEQGMKKWQGEVVEKSIAENVDDLRGFEWRDLLLLEDNIDWLEAQGEAWPDNPVLQEQARTLSNALQFFLCTVRTVDLVQQAHHQQKRLKQLIADLSKDGQTGQDDVPPSEPDCESIIQEYGNSRGSLQPRGPPREVSDP